MITKISQLFLVLFIFLFLTFPVRASENLEITFFWAQGCPHCAKEEVFLKTLEKKYPELHINYIEVTKDQENFNLFQTYVQELKIKNAGVPLTIIGEEHFVGYANDQLTGKQIERAIQETIAGQKEALPEKLSIPLLGEVNIKNLSLPTLAIVIGFLDGFNPCAMWALIFLISLLLGMKNKKRMWILGTTFIIASAFVYFLFMAAWLNFFLFIGLILWVRIVIGIAALGVGSYNIRQYYVNREGGCRVTESKSRRAIFEKLKEITKEKQFVLAIIGIVLLAFAVNLIELVCSAGFPAIFTHILTLSKLSTWQYYLYLLLYIFFFMIDDILVFFAAMITLHAVGLQTKYARFSHLIGGTIIFILGVLLIFKPEILMFG